MDFEKSDMMPSLGRDCFNYVELFGMSLNEEFRQLFGIFFRFFLG